LGPGQHIADTVHVLGAGDRAAVSTTSGVAPPLIAPHPSVRARASRVGSLKAAVRDHESPGVGSRRGHKATVRDHESSGVRSRREHEATVRDHVPPARACARAGARARTAAPGTAATASSGLACRSYGRAVLAGGAGGPAVRVPRVLAGAVRIAAAAAGLGSTRPGPARPAAVVRAARGPSLAPIPGAGRGAATGADGCQGGDQNACENARRNADDHELSSQNSLRPSSGPA
jgi:hypothetical protein